MDELTLASRLADLSSEAERLANTVYLDEDVPPERTRRHAHRLRETLGAALLLSERLARQTGNGPMVEMKEGPDGNTGEARFAVGLDGSEFDL